LNRRIPNVLAIITTGSATAIAAMIFQTITGNRILTPGVLGLDSLYVLMQTVVVFFLGSAGMAAIGREINFVMATILMVFFSMLLFKFMEKGGKNLLLLLMAGMIFGTLFSSISSFLQMVIDPNEFLIIQNRMFANFNSVHHRILALSVVTILLSLAFCFKDIRRLDVLALGRDHAINLGLPYEKMVRRLLSCVAILTAASTALVGPVAFLGLLIINLSHQIFKEHRHKILIPAAILISIIALVGGQFMVERVLGFSTTVGVVINFVGGIYFILLIIKEAKR
jgi:iron complex transport system permease protein